MVIVPTLAKSMFKVPLTPVIVECLPDADMQNVITKARNMDLFGASTRMAGQFIASPTIPSMPMIPFIPFPRLPALSPLPLTLHQMPLFKMFNLLCSPTDIENMASIDGVKSIFPDTMMYALEQAPFAEAMTKMTEGWITSATVDQYLGTDKARSLGVNGKGVHVAVVDTGVFQAHPQLAGNVRSYAVAPFGDVDEVGHGTWCVTKIKGASVVSPIGIKTYGIAPGCTMTSIKVLGFGIGTGTTSGVLKGMEMALELGADIISMSLGSDGIPQKDSPLCDIVNRTADKKIWVIAAGNSGPDAKTIGTPGNSERAITVGSWSIYDNAPAYFSSRGPSIDGLMKPDISSLGGGRKTSALKPDENIYSGVSPGSVLDGTVDKMKESFEPMKGTSMATPTAAGIIALWKQLKPDLTSADIMNIIAARGHSKDNDSGYGVMKFDWIL